MLQDLKYALRQLTKSPGFTAIAVLTLALGIGSATAMFSAIYGILLCPLPFPDADRLVTLRSNPDGRGGQAFPYAFNVSGPDYLDWAAQSRSFDGIAATSYQQVALIGIDIPRQLNLLGITSNYFDVFRAPLLLGRAFTREEAAAADGSRVILSHAFWVETFHSNPGIVGQTLKLESGPCTVVGVATPEMDFRQDVRPQLYAPINFPAIAQRSMRMLWTFGRLKPGVTLAQARAEMDSVAEQLKVDHPATNQNWSIRVFPLQEILTSAVRRPLILLYAATAAILMLACVNLATLMLVRAASRQREVSIRAALGASRIQLVRQLLIESLLLALIGGLLGTFFAWWGIDLTAGLARQLSAGGIEGATNIQLSGPVICFALLGVCGATLLFGTYPALHLSKAPLEAVRLAGSRGLTAARSQQRVLRALVIAQIALAFMLMIGAGLLTRSLLRLQQASPGFRPAGLLSVQLTRPNSTLMQPLQIRTSFADAVVARLNALPGVIETTAVNVLPFTGYNQAQKIVIKGRPLQPGVFMSAEQRMISPSYHRVLGIPILRGRGIERTDDGKHPVVVVDENFVRRFFAAEEPLGQMLILSGRPTEIVGIVGSVKDRGPGETEALPHFYIPLTQECQVQLNFIIRTVRDPSEISGSVQRAIAEVDPQQPIQRIALMDKLANQTMAPQRLSASLISCLAAFALLLSTLGVYGVMAFTVAQRTRELAIRMALGAPSSEIFRTVLLRGAVLASIGVGFGIIGAFALRRILSAFLFEISPFDPTSFASALSLILAAALFSCWIPARRATRVDPLIALHSD